MSSKLTIILPVYNGEKYLSFAIDSILNQSYQDFRLLIINDGSTDSSLAIAHSYRDKRITVVDQANQGLSAALNHGLDLASSQYVARMDHDDISHPDRFAVQIKFMDDHPDIGLCGTWAELIDKDSKKVASAAYPLNHDQITAFLLFNSPFCHPSVIFRKSVLDNHQLRYHSGYAEDLDLWIKLLPYTKFANLPQFLVRYRLGVGISSNSHKRQYDDCFEKIISSQVLHLMPGATQLELNLHRLIADFNYHPSVEDLKLIFQWFNKITEANLSKKIYHHHSLQLILAKQWLNLCTRSKLKLAYSPTLWFYSFITFFRLTNYNKINLLILCLKITDRHFKFL